MYGEYRIEQMSKANAMRFGDEAEQMAVTVETPWATVLHYLEAGLIMTVNEFVCYATSRSLVREFERLRAKPLNADHRDELVREYTPDGGGGLEILKAGQRHVFSAVWEPAV
jgi:hypothetical protein